MVLPLTTRSVTSPPCRTFLHGILGAHHHHHHVAIVSIITIIVLCSFFQLPKKALRSYIHEERKAQYDSIATVGEIRVYWRADFQSGSRVLKKVF